MEKNLNILIINGPNINMLGVREPEQYGSKSYKDLEKEVLYNIRQTKSKAILLKRFLLGEKIVLQ